MLKTLVFLLVAFFQFGVAGPVLAGSVPTTPTVYVFGGSSCELCRTEVKWLFDEGIPYEYLNIETNTQAKNWYDKLVEKHDLPEVTPLTVVGPELVVGYEKEQTTGRDLRRAITKAKKSDIVTIEDHLARAPVMTAPVVEVCEGLDCDTTNLQALTSVPLLGLVDLRDTSLLLVALILGAFSMTTLLSIGWLGVIAGLLIVMPRRLYVAALGLALLLVELAAYLYFFNRGYIWSSRFLLEATYAEVLKESVSWFLREGYVLVYSGVALIDTTIIILVVLWAVPWLQNFDERHPGSLGMIAAFLLFLGAAIMLYFVKFG